MNDLIINPNWTYKEIVLKLQALKCNYIGILASFSYFEIHNKVEWVYTVKKRIYSLNFEEWKRDRIYSVEFKQPLN